MCCIFFLEQVSSFLVMIFGVHLCMPIRYDLSLVPHLFLLSCVVIGIAQRDDFGGRMGLGVATALLV
jgi:hypothetical protein